jgi:hypothetical protein
MGREQADQLLARLQAEEDEISAVGVRARLAEYR